MSNHDDCCFFFSISSKTMETPPNPSFLDKFKYSFGDRTLGMLKYMLSLKNVTSYVDDVETLKPNMLIRYHCMKDAENPKKRTRVLQMPRTKISAQMDAMLQDPAQPIVVLPVMLIHLCRSQKRHMNYFLYNKKTHEIDRIDIKKYHVHPFKITLFTKSFISDLLPKIIEIDPKVVKTDDIEVSLAFMKRFPSRTAQSLYPVYMAVYLHLRSKYPAYKATTIQSKIAKLSNGEIATIWKAYEAYATDDDTQCDDSFVFNTETLRCNQRGTRAFANVLIDKPAKTCKHDKVYDVFTKRCTNIAKLKENTDIMLDGIMKYDIRAGFKFKSLGSVSNVIKSCMFVMSKHSNGHLILPSDIGKSHEKKEVCMIWGWNESTNDFHFSIPSYYWTSWDKGMLDGKVRFIISLVSLTSSLGGHHANLLLYDKQTNEIERFDGQGQELHKSYNPDGLDKQFKALFEAQKGIHLPEKFKYYTPLDFCPKMGFFQSKESGQTRYFKDARGNCAVWRLWYMDIRLKNPDLSRKDVVNISLKKISNFGSFRRFIKLYQAYIQDSVALDKNTVRD